jgi:rhamnulose-1-phosphate aldolase/alcohol dehydrogenase
MVRPSSPEREPPMTVHASADRLADLWDDAKADARDEPGRLLYRSNLLGSDLRITNFGGGNTSVKVRSVDPLTQEEVTVLWVKGSGGDLGSMRLEGFATLYLDRLERLKALYGGLADEDRMVGFLPHCTFGLNPRAASIDTPLHAFVPATHVDHVHPDAVIAIAASRNAEALTRDVFGGEIGFLAWQRPGFDLGLKLGAMATRNPHLAGVVLGGHGLFTWGETAKGCYLTTLRIIQTAADWLAANARTPAFGGRKVAPLAAAERAAMAVRLMPEIRGRISGGATGGGVAKVGHFTDSPEVLEFIDSQALDGLAPLGTSCPDHFLRTKIKPLIIPYDPAKGDSDNVINNLDEWIEGYRRVYAAYYERCRRPSSPPMRDPNAVIYLVPGVGMISFASDKTTARIASEFYVNAINVMRGATGVDDYVGLPEQEAFDIEYWLLEEAKLQRMPKPKSLAGRIALVTGGAGGIGGAIAAKLMQEGTCVMLADIDQQALETSVSHFEKAYGKDVVRGAKVDVTNEADVISSFEATVREFGGLDIVVNNAGISSAAPVEDTTLELWNRNISILATGYFLVAREGYRMLKRQGLGGSLVFISSKNGVAASPGASAYCTAKAAEIHLGRCMALEGAPLGIRVNIVNPDAVLRGSKIWQGEWRQQRAQSNKIAEEDLEEFYRKRSLLQRSVYPEDVAEAVYFFASDLSAKSTGNFLNVDAGNATSFSR